MHLASGQFYRHHTRHRPVGNQQVHHLVFIIEQNIVLDALLEHGLQDHVPGSVGGVAGAADRLAGDVVGMPAKGALGNPTVRRSRERQPHVLQVIYGLHGFIAHKFNRVLVAQVIRSFDSVESVPFGVVFFVITQRGADAALGRPQGMETIG